MHLVKQLLLPQWGWKLSLFLVFTILLDLAIGLKPITDPNQFVESDLTIRIIKDDKPNNVRFHVRRDEVFTNRNGQTRLIVPGGSEKVKHLDGAKVRVRLVPRPSSLFFDGADRAISIRSDGKWELQSAEAVTHFNGVFAFWGQCAAAVGAALLAWIGFEFFRFRRLKKENQHD